MATTKMLVASPANSEVTSEGQVAVEGQVSATGMVAPTASYPKESAESVATRHMLQPHHLMSLIDLA
jgi:hypothetical protein